MIVRSLARRLAEPLEKGWFLGPLARSSSWVWQRAATPIRRVSRPDGVRIVGVGGSVLGGSGKTPLTQSLARALRERGVRVAVVASGYLSPVQEPSVVRSADCAGDVGDEALMLARSLALHDVPVVVGRSRTDALALASTMASVVIVDGLLQARPKRLALSLLALDAARPWGAGRCPPAGDLRAARGRLLDACDAVVYMSERHSEVRESTQRPHYQLERRFAGARMPSGQLVGTEELSRLRLGACFGVARPERILQMLASHGIRPQEVWLDGDHRAPRPRPSGAPVDLWLVTPKCAAKLPTTLGRRPVAVLDVEWRAPESLISLAFARCAEGPPRAVSRVSEAPATC